MLLAFVPCSMRTHPCCQWWSRPVEGVLELVLDTPGARRARQERRGICWPVHIAVHRVTQKFTVFLGEMLRVPYLFGRARRIAQPLGPKQTCAPRRCYSPPMGNATPEEISETQLQVGRVLKTLGVGWLMYKSYQIACGSGMIFTGDARCACMPWTHDAHALGLLLSRYVPDFAITRAGALQESGESRDRYMARASLAFGRSRVARGRCTGRCRGAARDASERAARDAPHSPRAAYSHGALGQRAGTPHRQRGGLPRHR